MAPRLFWLVTLLGGIALSILTVILFAGLRLRFRDRAPIAANLGWRLGTAGGAAIGLVALIPQLGYATLARVYLEDRAAAIAAFYALRAAIDVLEGWIHLTMGFGVVASSVALFPERHYRLEGSLGVVTGLLYAGAVFALDAPLHLAANLLAILWLLAIGMALRFEERSAASDTLPSPASGIRSPKTIGGGVLDE